MKKAIKNVFGLNKEESEGEPELPAPVVEAATPAPTPEVVTESAPTRKKMVKAKSGSKYAKIDCLEEKAYQILKDLDMIEELN